MKRFFILFGLLLCSQAPAQELPETFQGTISYNGESFEVDYERFSNRSPNFEIWIQQADGTFAEYEPGEVRTYIGQIDELPGAMVSAVRKSNGETFYKVNFANGNEWVKESGATSQRTNQTWSPRWPTFLLGQGGAGSGIQAAEVAVDWPGVQFARNGSAADSLEMIEYSVNTTNLIYLRQTGTMHYIGRVILRANANHDPYKGLSGISEFFTELRRQWNTILPATFTMTHDVGLVAAAGLGGGLASSDVGEIGGPGYSSNSSSNAGDFANVWRHEVGHLWSLGHFDGNTPEGPTINSGNGLARMSGPEQALVIAHRDDRTEHIDNLGLPSLSIPPSASLDAAQYTTALTPITIDVVGNDHDANGDSISIKNFETKSLLGGTISRSVGTGPNGRDQLRYQPPLSYDQKVDRFRYYIVDSTGREALGYVNLRLIPNSDLLLHFTMNEGTGVFVGDSSPFVTHGDYKVFDEDANNWEEGIIDGSVNLNFFGYIESQARNTPTNHLTITGWIKTKSSPDSFPNGFAGFVYSKNDDSHWGFGLIDEEELAYNWGNEHQRWNSGLSVPKDTWTFVALTIAPDEATFYMDSGSGLQTASRTAVHDVDPLSAPIGIGWEGEQFSGFFSEEAQIDDIRVYQRTLNASEIALLANKLGSPSNPSPEPFVQTLTTPTALAWSPAPAATGYRVFLSNKLSEVQEALPDGPADKGIVNSPSFPLDELSNNNTYFWRVDSTDGTNWFPGPVWMFTVLNDLLARWKMDEGFGATAFNSTGNHLSAQFNSSPQWTEGIINGALQFDGLDDFLITTPPELSTNNLTITCWVYPEGFQNDFSAILFSRGGSTVSGLLFGPSRDLRYTWGGAHTQWLSRLVPSINQWNFIALSVSPEEATLYLDSGSGLRTAKNIGNHRIEAFDAALRIGADPDTSTRRFRGKIDDLRIYRRTLTLNEIANLNTRNPDSFSTWLQEKRDEGPDGDAFPTLVEYGLDLHPGQNDSPESGLQLHEGQIRLEVPTAGRWNYEQFLESSPDLLQWTTMARRDAYNPWAMDRAQELNITQNEPGRLILEATPEEAEDALFFRYRLQESSPNEP
ncbi:LamG domain-containing protein [Roseibacillus ishigakijimensis]|uniref:LamG domain-containing protein n=1 Tax=Roseibacillus ishigakijimensis TaxID=454146 RepID=A0A934RUI7_9BACT|nr:LamG domain-containing protein [Roseibacillus ishigakijimensis]MBK1835254.1 LamG domain-containing protein [Roseibacillus ishigakijimensis]